MDEEVVLLEEQLATAHAEVERLQAEVAELTAPQAEGDASAEELRRQLETSVAEAEAARQQVEAMTAETGRLEETVAGLQGAGRDAVPRYRELVLQREPDLPSDLVGGETIAEVDTALEQARQTVARVRQHLDEQARAQRVPAGAPPRGEPDASGLSSAEKIRLGLSRE